MNLKELMANHLDTEVKVDNKSIPLRVFVEPRRNVRISLGKKHVILRLPKGLQSRQIDEYMSWAEKWINTQFHTSDTIKNRFVSKTYENGDKLTLLGRSYTLYIAYEDRQSHAGKIVGTDMFLTLSNKDKKLNTQRAIKQLLSRLASHSFKPFISKRVHELNNLHFQQEITDIKIKYNSSNWGSCSSKGNVNLSSRLLFAPQEVIDYVIIHELAHLIELNHSSKFWSLVKKAMPSYKQKEKWLKDYGSSCDF